MLTQDKINIVLDELEELKETGNTLKDIEKVLPALDTQQYVKEKPKYKDIEILATASEVKLNPTNDQI